MHTRHAFFISAIHVCLLSYNLEWHETRKYAADIPPDLPSGMSYLASDIRTNIVALFGITLKKDLYKQC